MPSSEGPAAVCRRWHTRDTSRGVLDSEEHLIWRGPWPDAQARARVPALMAAAHTRSIRRFSLGLIAGRVTGPRVDFRLVGGPSVLALVERHTDCTESRIVRQWDIAPGLFARPPVGEPAHGTLTFGLERRDVRDLHAWMQVALFPSRFLGPAPLTRLIRARAWAYVGRLYATYHTHAAYDALASLARSLEGRV